MDHAGHQEEAPIGTSSAIMEESPQNQPNGSIHNEVPYQQIAENSELSAQLMYQASMVYQSMENGQIYYLQPFLYLPSQW